MAKSGSIPSAKLRELLHLVEWKGSSTEFNQIQQYLDPDMLGCISKNRFLKWRQCVATGIFMDMVLMMQTFYGR